MNDIIRPLTADGLVGWDEFGQFWIWHYEGKNKVGSMYWDVREKVCCICRRGWETTADSLRDQRYWGERTEWAHQSCTWRYQSLKAFDFWVGALVKNKFIFGPVDNPKTTMDGGPALQEIPNGYLGDQDPRGAVTPWYRARLLKKVSGEYGDNMAHGRTLKLGARKRVFHMEIEPGNGIYDHELAAVLFAQENPTKDIRADGMMIHAWGREKATEYLGLFSQILGVVKPEPAEVKG